MADAVDFPGSNRHYAPPEGQEDSCGWLHTFNNGACTVSCWQLRPEELAEVVRTGRIYLSTHAGDILFPVFVGSAEAVRGVVAAFGETFPSQESN